VPNLARSLILFGRPKMVTEVYEILEFAKLHYAFIS